MTIRLFKGPTGSGVGFFIAKLARESNPEQHFAVVGMIELQRAFKNNMPEGRTRMYTNGEFLRAVKDHKFKGWRGTLIVLGCYGSVARSMIETFGDFREVWLANWSETTLLNHNVRGYDCTDVSPSKMIAFSNPGGPNWVKQAFERAKPEGEAPQADYEDHYLGIEQALEMNENMRKYGTIDKPAAQHAESGAQVAIKTWRERAFAEFGNSYSGFKPDSFMEAEIADLRAALAAQSQGAQASANKAAEEGELPALPKHEVEGGYYDTEHGFTAAQMRDYARAAIAADRASRQVANKAEVEPKPVMWRYRRWGHDEQEHSNVWQATDQEAVVDIMLARKAIVEPLYATPPATTGASIPESELVKLLPGTYYMDEPDGGSPTVLEQLQRMAEDAAKYRDLNK